MKLVTRGYADMFHGNALSEFSNIGVLTGARRFPGFPSATPTEDFELAPRHPVRARLYAGDLLSFAQTSRPTPICLMAFDQKGHSALPGLGIEGETLVDVDRFDAEPLRGWVAARGGDPATLSGIEIDLCDLLAFEAGEDMTIWVVQLARPDDVVTCDYARSASFSIKRRAAKPNTLPEPLGVIRDEFTVRRGSALAYEVAQGEIVQIIDVEGQQCSDFMAFTADALDRGQEKPIDSTATRSFVRHSYPRPGLLDKFYDPDMRPMLQVVQDTCGRHDTFGLACTARGYEDRGFPGHLNCSDNISAAVESYGVARRAAWPAINFFWNTWVDPLNQQILTEESHSRPGDYVAMRALERLVCVSTACPDDVDPINGWNPTDVHVRIYRPEARLQRAVAYREKEDAPMSISHESAFHPRTSTLTQHFAPARDLWVPVSYPATGTVGEYWACRDRATLQDMSSLRKYDIVGPDAEALLQKALSRDVARVAVWRGTYALMCDETGAIIDDGTLFRLAPDVFRWCCGSEESARVLNALAKASGLQARVHTMNDTLVNLSLQGPKSREILQRVAFTQPHVPSLTDLKWFGVTIGRLQDREGVPFMLSRTGYTGELGYELFCAPSHAVELWDALMEAGAEAGLVPMGNAALETLRIEAGFAAAGAEFSPGTDAFEAGLGFAVDLRKSEFTGKDALARNSQTPRRVQKGLLFSCNDVPLHGAPVFAGERQIGQVTSATRSPQLECSIALARLAVEFSETGTELEVGMMDGRMKRLPARVSAVPFIDPKREKARA